MKVTIIEKEETTPDFPALYETKSGKIVLMYKNKTGTVIHATVEKNFGYYSDDWDMKCFKKITTPVTIRFEP